MLSHAWWLSVVPTFSAGLVAFLTGVVWYSAARAYGGAAMYLSAAAPDDSVQNGQYTSRTMLIGFLATLWMAWVLSYVLQAFSVFDWISAAEVGFWCWAGFVAPSFLSFFFLKHVSLKSYSVHVLYWLVAMILMSIITVVVWYALMPVVPVVPAVE